MKPSPDQAPKLLHSSPQHLVPSTRRSDPSAQDIDVMILCGGMGVRLRSVVSDRPKSMAEINGKPFLHYLLKQISNNGFKRVILCVGYKADLIENYFKDKYLKLEIVYSKETEPLGTGGAVKLALPYAQSEYMMIMNGDSYINANLGRFVENSMSSKREASILITEVKNVARFGRIIFDDGHRILSFEEKGQYNGEGYINSGIYLLKQNILREIPSNIKYSLEMELFPQLVKKRELSASLLNGKFIDIGTPESYKKAEKNYSRFRS